MMEMPTGLSTEGRSSRISLMEICVLNFMIKRRRSVWIARKHYIITMITLHAKDVQRGLCLTLIFICARPNQLETSRPTHLKTLIEISFMEDTLLVNFKLKSIKLLKVRMANPAPLKPHILIPLSVWNALITKNISTWDTRYAKSVWMVKF